MQHSSLFLLNKVNAKVNYCIFESLETTIGQLLYAATPTHTVDSKMPTVRNARSLVTSRELPSGLQIWGKRPAECIVLSGYNEADTDSASTESVKVIQERVAHGTLYVSLTCPTMDNRHNKPRLSSRILTVRNFKFNLSTF